MIRIAIVDDEKRIREIVEETIKNTAKSNEKIALYTYESGEEFLESLKNNQSIDILFTDIKMGGINGIELGKIIETKYPEITYIYLTAHGEFAAKSYTMETFQYILKSELGERMPSVLQKAIQQHVSKRHSFVILGSEFDKRKVYYDEIFYIEKIKSSKYIEYITASGHVRERQSLSNAMKNLQSDVFVMVDRGYIVNMKHIRRITKNVIEMEDGKNIGISRVRIIRVKEELQRYWSELQWKE